ncbi:MAG TPA: hypothetical protein VH374_17325 [Polyangia bacterium]|jgi:hypothetical protein|nr:hypothetical protein [Polyangia bacterium]
MRVPTINRIAGSLRSVLRPPTLTNAPSRRMQSKMSAAVGWVTRTERRPHPWLSLALVLALPATSFAEDISVERATAFLAKKKPCVLWFAAIRDDAGRNTVLNGDVVCFFDGTKFKDSIKEQPGCLAARYDMSTGEYEPVWGEDTKVFDSSGEANDFPSAAGKCSQASIGHLLQELAASTTPMGEPVRMGSAIMRLAQGPATMAAVRTLAFGGRLATPALKSSLMKAICDDIRENARGSFGCAKSSSTFR